MGIRRTAFVLALCLGSPLAYGDELAPPNISVYADMMFALTQTKNLTYPSMDGKVDYHHGDTDGYRARLGVRLNDLNRGPWHFGLEGGLVQLTNDDTQKQYNRAPQTHLDGETAAQKVQVEGEHSLEISGFELAGRVWFKEYAYARAGALVYTEKTRLREHRFYRDSQDKTLNRANITEADSQRRAAPFMSVGAQFPVIKNVYVAGEYTAYHMDSEWVSTIAAGVQLLFH